MKGPFIDLNLQRNNEESLQTLAGSSASRQKNYANLFLESLTVLCVLKRIDKPRFENRKVTLRSFMLFLRDVELI